MNLTPGELARMQRLTAETRERIWRVIDDMAARGFDVYVGQTTRTVEEVAASIVFLASPAAQYITGATLRIDGAQSLWGHTWEIP